MTTAPPVDVAYNLALHESPQARLLVAARYVLARYLMIATGRQRRRIRYQLD